MPINLSSTEAIEYAQRYQSLLLSACQTGRDQFSQLRELAAFWGLASLCFFHSIHETPVKLIHDYCRWLHFYFGPREIDLTADSFAFDLAALVASRDFEQASVCLRHLILDGAHLFQKSPDQLELVLERLLTAPSPIQTVEIPALFIQWIAENKMVFAEEVGADSNWVAELYPTVALLKGDLAHEGLRDKLDWKIRFSATCLYEEIPSDYERLVELAMKVAPKDGGLMDKLLHACIRLSVDSLLEQFSITKEPSMGILLVASHFADLLLRLSLVTYDEVRPCIVAWIEALIEKPHHHEVALTYALAYNDQDSMRTIITSMDEDRLPDILQGYSHIPMLAKIVRTHLSSRARLALTRGDYRRAYSMAVLAENQNLADMIVFTALDDYGERRDERSLLHQLCPLEEETIERGEASEGISIIHKWYIMQEGSCAERINLLHEILSSSFPLPPAFQAHLLDLLYEMIMARDDPSPAPSLSRSLLTKALEIIEGGTLEGRLPLESISNFRRTFLQRSSLS